MSRFNKLLRFSIHSNKVSHKVNNMARTKVTVNKKREQSHESEDRDTLMSTAKSYIWTTVGTEEGTNFKVYKFEEFTGQLKRRKRTRSPKKPQEDVEEAKQVPREPRSKCDSCNTFIVKHAKFCHHCGEAL